LTLTRGKVDIIAIPNSPTGVRPVPTALTTLAAIAAVIGVVVVITTG
jgi:hypothetical protein